MRIIGTYVNGLSDAYLQQLTQLAFEASAAGDYGGGKLLTAEKILEMKQQAADFDAIPFVQAGSRANDESIEQAVNTIRAKYGAISDERNRFILQMGKFLGVLNQDNEILDSMIRMADLERWVRYLPSLTGGKKFYWDFWMSPGVVPSDSTTRTDRVSRLDSGSMLEGLRRHLDDVRVSPIRMQWSSEPEGTVEMLYGSDWAKLSVLKDEPATFWGDPELKMINPPEGHPNEWREFFEVTGKNTSSNIPVMIRNRFLKRRTTKDIKFDMEIGSAVRVSNYRILVDDLDISDDTKYYFRGIDYLVTDGFLVQPLKGMFNKTLSVSFTEYYPAVQFSVNGKNWSTPLMLDPERPTPDFQNTSNDHLVKDGKFLITDETGYKTGLFLSVVKTISREFTVSVQNARPDTGAGFGLPATLEIEFDKPFYLNGVHLTPFTNFPSHLRSIYAEGLLGSNPQYVWTGNHLIDTEQEVLFSRREVLKLKLTFWQETYSIKDHLVDDESRQKTEALIALQSVLPVKVRQSHYPVTRQYTGCQYEYGFREIQGLYTSFAEENLKGASVFFTSGPYRVEGVPDIIRLDLQSSGSVPVSIVSREHNADGVTEDDVKTTVVSGEPYSYTKVRTGAQSVELFVEMSLDTAESVAKRFCLQVTNV